MIESIKSFFKELHSREGSISSKRFWGGVLIVNSIVLSYIHFNLQELISSFLLAGVGLLGAGIADHLKGMKDDK